MTPKTEKGQICIGRFSDPHGVKGGIRLKGFTEQLATLKTYQDYFSATGDPLKLTFGQKLKDGFVITMAGVTTPEDAKKLKGTEVFVKRAELKTLNPGEYYHADLIGLNVVTGAGETLGKISAVNNYGAGDVIEITLEKFHKGVGKVLVVPHRGDVVKDIDMTSGTMTIDPEGWLEI